ncbi:glycoside hydrolase family 26 protein [Streptomyces sp. HD]|uniref:glycoside hydrolase family 26 protein n=1 Tax=Streptomyces sp. HD TaxID=3020892 RepID=UPI00232BAB4B|nr:glycosyl hydrolase [Streptomyces sp. HD]MDC0765564.1 glycosyl hydrolase [Streptomyces sp. HD]
MAPDRRRSTPRGLAFITAGVVASTALAPGTAFGADTAPHREPRHPEPMTQSAPRAQEPPGPPVDDRPAPRPDPVTSPTSPMSPTPPDPAHAPQGVAAYGPAFGAFLHYGPVGLERMKQLSRWLGGHELRVGHTYLPGDLWSNIEGAHGFLDSWAEWRRAKDDRMLVLNVPMMERNEEHLSDAAVRKLLGQAASGAFDDHFEVLAKRLVALGVPDTVVVLGWEMNGITYTHRCGPDPDAWKRYWQRIVTVMRSVPGQKFKFDFAPSRGMDAIPWPECYPGDEFVDVIGMDAYDQPHGLDFDEQVSEPYGLQHHVDFARKHGKPISYPEWGLFRNGDNIRYMLRMLAWMDQYKPLYNTITDYCPHGVWLCSDNPHASALYRDLLSSPLLPRPEPGPSATTPTVPTASPEPGKPAGPSPTPVPAEPSAPPATPYR